MENQSDLPRWNPSRDLGPARSQLTVYTTRASATPGRRVRTVECDSSAPFSPDSLRLDGRVAVVTGGGTGIGRGVARTLANFGSRVAVWEKDPDTAGAAADEVNGLGLLVDVREADQVEAALAETTERLGCPTILVNNAGGTFATPFLDSDERGWNALHRANLLHVILCTHRVARAMVAAGLGGSIVNVTSIEAHRAAPLFAAYAAAKAGVANFTKTAALELAEHGIRVNAVAPDLIRTEGLEALAGPRGPSRWNRIVPLGRAGTPEEVGGAVVFLASDLSSYVTGETIHVDGGTFATSGWFHRPEGGGYGYGP